MPPTVAFRDAKGLEQVARTKQRFAVGSYILHAVNAFGATAIRPS